MIAISYDLAGLGRRALLAASGSLLLITGALSLFEFGLYVDGPGVGFFSLEMAPFTMCSWVPFLIITGILGNRTRDRSQRRQSAVTATLVCATFLALHGPTRFCALSWDRRCDAGDSEACFAAGELYAYGVDIPRDPQRGGERYRRACAAGHEISCNRIKRNR